MNQFSNLLITPETEISEIVFKYPKAILFLEHFDVKLPLQALTVKKTCEVYGISSDLFIAFANLYIDKGNAQNPNLKISDLPLIINYLKNSHKYYLNEIYPNIQQCIQNIQSLNDFSEIKMVDKFFKDYFKEVVEHLDYENNVAFPYFTDLYNRFTKSGADELAKSYSVTDYKEHHSDIEEKLDDLMSLLIKYLPVKNDRQERRKLFLYLVQLDFDLKVHANIEDLILVPLVEKLEHQLRRI
ncbi:MAG: hypothetical protein U0W24_10055 [Bacteroidales bacterium]